MREQATSEAWTAVPPESNTGKKCHAPWAARKHLGNHASATLRIIELSNGAHHMDTTTSLTFAEAASSRGMVKTRILSAIKSCRFNKQRMV